MSMSSFTIVLIKKRHFKFYKHVSVFGYSIFNAMRVIRPCTSITILINHLAAVPYALPIV